MPALYCGIQRLSVLDDHIGPDLGKQRHFPDDLGRIRHQDDEQVEGAIVLNNAGFGLIGAVEEATAAKIEAVYRTNVFGLLTVTRAVLPYMRAARSGRILNISSIGGYRTGAGFGVYASTKFAVEELSEALHANSDLWASM